jgi:hypothetical protein
MGFNFVILSLAAYSLWPDRGAGGISALLLRDGIGYFAAEFAAANSSSRLTNYIQWNVEERMTHEFGVTTLHSRAASSGR